MSNEAVEVLIVGGGQAGLAMSEHLSACDVSHLVLERHRVAERWRSERWDSLVANGPAWHDRFPGLEFDLDPDAFASKEQVVEYFETYAQKIDAPIRCGVEVLSVRRNVDRAGFRTETTDGPIEARYVVAATGAFQQPLIPPILPESAGVMQMHSSGYRNPGQLPDGAVLVVGAGSSGVQIADELRGAGRSVYLCVGPHDRPPRRYRGRDFCWWLGVLNKWDAEAPQPGAAHVTIAVSGALGGHTVDFRDLERRGITLLGFMTSFEDGTIRFAPDLAENIAQGDAQYLSLLDEADAYVARTGLDFPEEPEAHELGPLPTRALDPVRELDLAGAGVTAVSGPPASPPTTAGSRSTPSMQRQAGPPARRLVRAGGLLPGTALAVTTRIDLHLGRVARRQARGRPHRDAERLPGVRRDGWGARMTVHRRIRPFNTRETYPEQDLDNDLCQAVVAGSTVYLRGQIGQDLDTAENVGVGDVEAQAEQAMKNIKLLLEEAGGGLEHIVKVTVYLIDPRYREPVYRVMGRWLKGVHPVSTGIVVSALARPEWLVEIDATAVLA